MATVQIVLGMDLLKAVDRAAKRRSVSRSAFVREALREHLKRLAAKALEQRDRSGYKSQPIAPSEFGAWDDVAAWPDE